MAATIRIKRSGTSGNPAILAAGELAYSSLTDNGSNGGDRLYVGTGTETTGNAANHVVIGGKYFTDAITAATNANTASTLVKRDSSGNFSAGTITAALTGNSSTTTALATGRTIAITGDLSYTSPSFDGSGNVTAAGTLATLLDGSTNKVAGSFGGAGAVPIITVDAKGRITAITTAATSSALSIAGGTGTDTVTVGTDTLTFAGGTGVATTVTNNQVSFAIGQAVATTSNVTFNDLTVSGNLTVSGTTTSINTTTLNVTDINITVANGAANAAAANGAGLTVAGPTTPATFTYTSADDRWNLNKNLNVTTVFGALSGNATTATTATNIAAGAAGSIPYQTGSGATSMLATGTGVLVGGATPSYSTAPTLTGTNFTGIPNGALTNSSVTVGTTAIALGASSTTLAGLTSVSSTAFTGALTGNASSASYASAVTITEDVSTVTAVYPAWVGANTGNIAVKTASTKLSFVPSTGILTATGFAGSGAGLTSIPNGALTNSSVTVGTTAIALGASSTTLAGLTSVSSTAFTGALTGNASTATTLATGRTIEITGDLTYISPSFNGSGNVTAIGTLATVNSNTGSFGSGTSVATFTVNAKGLITAAGTAAIPTATSSVLGLSSFNSTDFLVTTGAVSIASVDGGTY